MFSDFKRLNSVVKSPAATQFKLLNSFKNKVLDEEYDLYVKTGVKALCLDLEACLAICESLPKLLHADGDDSQYGHEQLSTALALASRMHTAYEMCGMDRIRIDYPRDTPPRCLVKPIWAALEVCAPEVGRLQLRLAANAA